MEGRLLIRDCAVWQAGGVLVGRSVLIDGETISAVDAPEVLKARPGDWVADARGRLVTPGLFDDGKQDATSPELHALRVATALRHGVTGLLSAHSAVLGVRVVSRAPDRAALIEPGQPADLVLWDVVPGAGFALPQLTSAIAAWVIVAGRVVVREGQLVGADFVSIASAAAAR